MAALLGKGLRLGSTLSHGDGNGTGQIEWTNLPVNILETFLPGYSLLSKFLLDVFGFDASLVVSLLITVWGLTTTLGYIYRKPWTQIDAHFTASVVIDSSDDMQEYMMRWIAEHNVSQVTRTLKARDNNASSWDEADQPVPVDSVFDSSQGDFLINLSNWEAKIPPVFEPYRTSKWFRHRGHFFRFQREKLAVLDVRSYQRTPRDDEQLTITVLGRSTQPIKDLIIEARASYLSKKARKTTVRRPSPKYNKMGGRAAHWTQVAVRPSRPIETVVLDSTEKRKLLADINEYLQPATRIWYSNRGIPYRRGYLFHGPPGTGKTSLSFAIAGIFGIDIFSLSLLDPGLTEEDLGMLFSNLPRHCVVLLEDIDSAGLSRHGDSEPVTGTVRDDGSTNVANADATEPQSSKVIPNGNHTSVTRRRRPAAGTPETPEDGQRGISLSGLLNAIDGVASHEGRVLVMTTNHPEKLDPALIRPGRVDLMVEFTLATRDQIRELFLRMYSDTTLLDCQVHGEGNVHTAPLARPPMMNGLREKSSSHSKSGTIQHKLDTKDTSPDLVAATTATAVSVDLESLATEFAASLPDSVLSPAEVQGFLLTRKKEPQRAVQEVETWRDEILRTRRVQREGWSAFSSTSELMPN